MSTPKNRLKFIKKMPFQTVGIILILLVATALLWISNANSNEAVLATSAQVYFEGEYRIGNGQWQNVIAGQHIPATKGDVTEQMFKYRRSGLDRFFHHCEVMENKDEKNYLELAAKHDLDPKQLLMIGNSVKSDIAPVVNTGGWAIHTPHDVVWVHEMMDMPESDRIIEVENIRENIKYLL